MSFTNNLCPTANTATTGSDDADRVGELAAEAEEAIASQRSCSVGDRTSFVIIEIAFSLGLIAMSHVSEQILQTVEALPAEDRQLVLDFVEFIWAKRQQAKASEPETAERSFFEVAQASIGAGEGPGKLSTKPDYMREYLNEILDRASQDSEEVTIVRGNKSFVLIPQDELEALIETFELLKDPTLLADIQKAREEYLQGDALTMDRVFG